MHQRGLKLIHDQRILDQANYTNSINKYDMLLKELKWGRSTF